MTIARAQRRYSSETPPHNAIREDDGTYWCDCIACEGWREERVLPGCLVTPATLQPSKYGSSSNRPAWRFGEWGWNYRMPHGAFATVVGSISKDDKKNGGHLNCVVIFCHWDNVLRVTSAKWLSVLYDPSVDRV